MRTLYSSLSIALLLAMGVSTARAQQQSQQQQQSPQETQNQATQPIQAYRSPFATAADNGPADVDPQELVPDTRPLAGAQDLSLGAPKTGHNFWEPYFAVGTTLDSNPPSSTNNAGWTTFTQLQGGINLHRVSGNSDLTLNYLGGGSFSNDGSIGNSIMQQLGVVERLTYRRATISFMDQLAYLPEAGFGYYGLGGLNQSLAGGPIVQGVFTPNQSVLTAQGQRISNTSLIEVDTLLTPRSSLTIVGSYGLLNYIDNDLANTTEGIIQAGYNYQLTRKDTIALLYRFDAFRFSNITQSINSDSILFSYARRATGRLAFQIAGGPEIAFSQTPIPGSSGSSSGTVSTGTAASKTTQLFWTLNTMLTYQWRLRALLSLFYSHGLTNGSGVLAGSVADNVSGSISRQLTHTMRAAWTSGYSRNTGSNLTQTSASTLTLTPSSQTYNYWYTGVNFTRSWGRSMNLSLGYNLQYQESNLAFCVTTPCRTSYVANQINLSLGWQPRPYTF